MLSEEARVDTGLGNADPVARRAVQADEVLRLGGTGGDEAIGLGCELTLGLRTQRVQRKSGTRLGECEGVERLHPRDVPLLAELATDDSAVPVMAMDGAIRTSLRLRVAGWWRR